MLSNGSKHPLSDQGITPDTKKKGKGLTMDLSYMVIDREGNGRKLQGRPVELGENQRLSVYTSYFFEYDLELKDTDEVIVYNDATLNISYTTLGAEPIVQFRIESSTIEDFEYLYQLILEKVNIRVTRIQPFQATFRDVKDKVLNFLYNLIPVRGSGEAI